MDENMNVYQEDHQEDMPYLENAEEEEYDYDDAEDMSEDDASISAAIDKMRISVEERQWALAIKKAVIEETPRLRPLTDMDYAQHALTSEGNVEKALNRIERMQWCRDEYRIDDTPEQGSRSLRELMKVHPGFLLHLDICPDTGEGIFAGDNGAYYPAVSLECSATDRTAEQSWKMHIKAQYYLLRAMNPSLQSIREGCFILWEASTMKFANFNDTYARRMHDEMRHHYPTNYKKGMVYNPSVEANILFSLAKLAMPRDFTMVVELGCQVHQTDMTRPRLTLRELYLQPTPEEAYSRFLKRAGELFTIRAENEKTFRL